MSGWCVESDFCAGEGFSIEAAADLALIKYVSARSQMK